ncbi:hypothetical protein PoB_001564600 [Plakobranchus ocellatus]|uniref:Uncharacterized protein n=1 Tax=Plakobranchus ocellatus TaxID=259542 RepID=A0AAV3Z3I3_9GAST|nr:hypothetical protein PoB_001564600 [Plakobranchus ocellatus]
MSLSKLFPDFSLISRALSKTSCFDRVCSAVFFDRHIMIEIQREILNAALEMLSDMVSRLLVYAFWASVTVLMLASTGSAMDPAYGHWGEWSEMSECSATCGSGTRQATRVFIPGPKAPPREEPYTGTSTFTCTNPDFPECPQDGVWSGWSRWTECTKACGGGERRRKRGCHGIMFGGKDCEGENFEEEKCGKEPCPRLPPHFDMSICTPTGNFTCASGKMCIDAANKCDKKVQCHDGSDEMGCPRWGRSGGLRYDLGGGATSIMKTCVWSCLAALLCGNFHLLTWPRWVTSVCGLISPGTYHSCYLCVVEIQFSALGARYLCVGHTSLSLDSG